MQSVKISSIKTMTASPDQQIQIDGIIDLEHMVNSLDDLSFELISALVQKRLSDAALADIKKRKAISHLEQLKKQIKK